MCARAEASATRWIPPAFESPQLALWQLELSRAPRSVLARRPRRGPRSTSATPRSGAHRRNRTTPSATAARSRAGSSHRQRKLPLAPSLAAASAPTRWPLAAGPRPAPRASHLSGPAATRRLRRDRARRRDAVPAAAVRRAGPRGLDEGREDRRGAQRLRREEARRLALVPRRRLRARGRVRRAARYAPRGDGTRRAGNTMTAPSSRPSASSMRRRVAGDRRLARRCGLGTPTRWRPPRCGVVPRVAE